MGLRDQMNAQGEWMRDQISKQDGTYQNLQTTLKRIEARFEELATKYSELADKYAAALGREAELKERIRILEAPKLGERSGPW